MPAEEEVVLPEDGGEIDRLDWLHRELGGMLGGERVAPCLNNIGCRLPVRRCPEVTVVGVTGLRVARLAQQPAAADGDDERRGSSVDNDAGAASPDGTLETRLGRLDGDVGLLVLVGGLSLEGRGIRRLWRARRAPQDCRLFS
jgi:hypothetical protein